MDPERLRAVAVDEIHWICGTAPEAELWAGDAWLGVAERDGEWMLAVATTSAPASASVATSTFTHDAVLKSPDYIAGAGVVAEPATTARVVGTGPRDVVAATSRIWLAGLARDDADESDGVRVELIDSHGNPTGEAVSLQRSWPRILRPWA